MPVCLHFKGKSILQSLLVCADDVAWPLVILQVLALWLRRLRALGLVRHPRIGSGAGCIWVPMNLPWFSYRACTRYFLSGWVLAFNSITWWYRRPQYRSWIWDFNTDLFGWCAGVKPESPMLLIPCSQSATGSDYSLLLLAKAYFKSLLTNFQKSLKETYMISWCFNRRRFR